MDFILPPRLLVFILVLLLSLVIIASPGRGAPLKITFIGHSTALIELNGRFVLTDPNFSPRIKMLVRQSPPGLMPKDLPPFSAVLISHAHYDHLDLPSLAALPPSAPLVVPPGVASLLKDLGSRTIITLRPWESTQVDGIKITATPARHYIGRWFIDGLWRGANGYVMESQGGCVFFAGDTAMMEAFRKIGKRFTLDAALLPIGANNPRWVMKFFHLDPAEALQAEMELNASYMIPIHWGAFRLAQEKVDAPATKLQELARSSPLGPKVILLQPGESFSLPGKENRE